MVKSNGSASLITAGSWLNAGNRMLSQRVSRMIHQSLIGALTVSRERLFTNPLRDLENGSLHSEKVRVNTCLRIKLHYLMLNNDRFPFDSIAKCVHHRMYGNNY